MIRDTWESIGEEFFKQLPPNRKCPYQVVVNSETAELVYIPFDNISNTLYLYQHTLEVFSNLCEERKELIQEKIEEVKSSGMSMETMLKKVFRSTRSQKVVRTGAGRRKNQEVIISSKPLHIKRRRYSRDLFMFKDRVVTPPKTKNINRLIKGQGMLVTKKIDSDIYSDIKTDLKEEMVHDSFLSQIKNPKNGPKLSIVSEMKIDPFQGSKNFLENYVTPKSTLSPSLKLSMISQSKRGLIKKVSKLKRVQNGLYFSSIRSKNKHRTVGRMRTQKSRAWNLASEMQGYKDDLTTEETNLLMKSHEKEFVGINGGGGAGPGDTTSNSRNVSRFRMMSIQGKKKNRDSSPTNKSRFRSASNIKNTSFLDMEEDGHKKVTGASLVHIDARKIKSFVRDFARTSQSKFSTEDSRKLKTLSIELNNRSVVHFLPDKDVRRNPLSRNHQTFRKSKIKKSSDFFQFWKRKSGYPTNKGKFRKFGRGSHSATQYQFLRKSVRPNF